MGDRKGKDRAQKEKKYAGQALIVSAILTVVLFAILTFLNHYLKNPVAEQGVISFELEQEIDNSLAIISSWDGREKMITAFSLGIDYLFLVAYALFFALSCYFSANKIKERHPALYRVGLVVSAAQILAGLLDAVENYGLLRLLLGSRNEAFAKLAFYSASFKFGFIFTGILYICIVLIWIAPYRRRASHSRNR